MSDNNLPKYIYHDIVLHNKLSTGSNSQRLQFQETRNTPLVKNTELYEMSVVRFQIDTYSLPSFVADIKPNQISHTLMQDIITMESYNGQIVSTPLTWIPQNKHLSAPEGNVGDSIDHANEFYYGNNFSHYATLLNSAFNSCTNILKALDASLNTMQAPYTIWNDNQH